MAVASLQLIIQIQFMIIRSLTGKESTLKWYYEPMNLRL